jgi:hypothetical protein
MNRRAKGTARGAGVGAAIGATAGALTSEDYSRPQLDTTMTSTGATYNWHEVATGAGPMDTLGQMADFGVKGALIGGAIIGGMHAVGAIRSARKAHLLDAANKARR